MVGEVAQLGLSPLGLGQRLRDDLAILRVKLREDGIDCRRALGEESLVSH